MPGLQATDETDRELSRTAGERGFEAGGKTVRVYAIGYHVRASPRVGIPLKVSADLVGKGNQRRSRSKGSLGDLLSARTVYQPPVPDLLLNQWGVHLQQARRTHVTGKFHTGK